jgi:hypothetical protein
MNCGYDSRNTINLISISVVFISRKKSISHSKIEYLLQKQTTTSPDVIYNSPNDKRNIAIQFDIILNSPLITFLLTSTNYLFEKLYLSPLKYYYLGFQTNHFSPPS